MLVKGVTVRLWMHSVWHSIEWKRQLDSTNNIGSWVAHGAFCTRLLSSMYTVANEAPLVEHRLKLSMHNILKTRSCFNNAARHAPSESDRTTRDLYAPRPNGRGCVTQPSTCLEASRQRQPWSLQGSMRNWSSPWEHPTFHQEYTKMIQIDTTSFLRN